MRATRIFAVVAAIGGLAALGVVASSDDASGLVVSGATTSANIRCLPSPATATAPTGASITWDFTNVSGADIYFDVARHGGGAAAVGFSYKVANNSFDDYVSAGFVGDPTEVFDIFTSPDGDLTNSNEQTPLGTLTCDVQSSGGTASLHASVSCGPWIDPVEPNPEQPVTFNFANSTGQRVWFGYARGNSDSPEDDTGVTANSTTTGGFNGLNGEQFGVWTTTVDPSTNPPLSAYTFLATLVCTPVTALFTYSSTLATTTCAGGSGSVMISDAYTESASGVSPHQVWLDRSDPNLLVPLTTAQGPGSDTHTFTNVPPGAHTVSFFDPSDGETDVPVQVCGSTSSGVSLLTIGTNTTVTYGGVTRISTTAYSGTTPVPHATVGLFGRARSSGKFSLVKTSTTNAAGRISIVIAPQAFREYFWAWRSAAGDVVVVSKLEVVSVTQHVTLHSTAASVPANTFFKLWGGVAPSAVNQVVRLQWLNAGRWVTTAIPAKVVKTKLPNGTTGYGYVFVVSMLNKGTFHWRTYVSARVGKGLGAGTSQTVTVAAT